MKIICVGRNYAAHIEELNNERPDEPVIFTKPETALLLKNKPFYHPSYSENIHHEIELVYKISRNGKNVEAKFAHRYYESLALGIDFTARDLQDKAKSKGLPWALAKGFDNSAPLSKFVAVDKLNQEDGINFGLKINGDFRQQGNTKHMLWSIDEIIAYISQFMSLKMGDLIFTGTPKGVGQVNVGDQIEGYIGEEKLLDFEVR